MPPATDPSGDLAEIHAGYHLEPHHKQALDEAYAVLRAHHGPFMSAIAARMLPDLQAEVRANPAHRVVFLGRDGFSLATATARLDPEFFTAHCSQIVLSRSLTEAALQDRDRNLGESFSALGSFRQRVAAEPAAVPGSAQKLTRYLRSNNIPVGHADSAVTLVDTSFKGTVQEMLAALYPATTFTGRYAFFGASPDDPHPGSKQGYVFHREVDEVWQGIPQEELPADPALTFGAAEAIATIEETMHGPLSSPKMLLADGPSQQPQSAAPNPLAGLNPIRVAPGYRDPLLRDAIKTVALLAVDHSAAHLATHSSTETREAAIQHSLEAFTGHVRAWITRDHQHLNLALEQLLDSFVRRPDRRLVTEFATLLTQAHVSAEQATSLWRQFDALPTLSQKQRFLEQHHTTRGASPSQAARAARSASAALRPPASAQRPASSSPTQNHPRPPAPLDSSQQPRKDGPGRGR